LRKGAHDKELITKTSQLNERDFIIRMLYKNCYYKLLLQTILLVRPTYDDDVPLYLACVNFLLNEYDDDDDDD